MWSTKLKGSKNPLNELYFWTKDWTPSSKFGISNWIEYSLELGQLTSANMADATFAPRHCLVL